MPKDARRLGPWALQRRLAVGGMAELYLARPIAGGAPVVVKKLHRHLSESDSFVRMFLDEARIAAQLSHPGIARIVDLGCDGPDWFLVLEYVPGADLELVLDEAGKAKLQLQVPLAVQLVVELLEALGHAHDASGLDGRPLQLVHRDVTPSNVIVTPEGRVVLCDFGIAKAVDTLATAAGVVKGKFRYMAPEQARGRTVDRRTDLFAVGVLLYELSTGKSPFARSDDAQVIRAVIAEDPAPPEKLVPGFPPAITAALRWALQKDPAKRPPDADALRSALADWLEADGGAPGRKAAARLLTRLGLGAPEPGEQPLAGVGPASAVTLPPAPLTLPAGARPPPPLAGREDALQTLLAAAQLARRGARASVVLGPPGAGRSRLLDELAARLSSRGFRVLRAEGARPPGAPDLPAKLAASLRVALPGPTRSPTGTAVQQGTRWEALRAAVEAAGPVALLVDDVDLGPPAELDALEGLALGLGERPVFLAVTAGPFLDEIRPGVFPGREVVELEPLPAPAARSLLASRGAAAPVVAELLARADGWPLTLVEQARLLELGLPAADVPSGRDAVLRARLAQLPEPLRRAAELSFVLGPVSRREDVELLAPGTGAALEPLVDEGLLERVGAGRFQFARPAWRDAVGAAIEPAARPRWHRLAAEALLGRGEDGDLVDAAEHFERAGETKRATASYLAAAHRARERLELPEAVRLHEQALRLATEPRARFALAAALEGQLGRAGKRDRQRAIAEELSRLANLLGPHERAAAKLAWLELLSATDPASARGLVEETIGAQRTAGALRGEARARAIAARLAIAAGQGAAAVAQLGPIRTLAGRAGEPALAVEAEAIAAHVLEKGGQLVRARRRLAHALDRTLKLGDERAAIRRLLQLGALGSILDEGSASLAALEKARTLALQLGDEPEAARALLERAAAVRRLGRIAEAVVSGEGALQELAMLREPAPQSLVRSELALALLDRAKEGDAARAASLAQEALQLARRAGDVWAEHAAEVACERALPGG